MVVFESVFRPSRSRLSVSFCFASVPGAADNHSNRTGPFYIYPAAKPNYHLSWDSNNRLVLTNVTGKHHMFYIIKPGSNGHLDTVSFQSAADPTLYIVKEAQGLKVLQKKQIHPSLGSWETVTSFFIFQNKFQSVSRLYVNICSPRTLCGLD